MNLYEFSQSNNDEMGILVSKKDDEKLYNEILKESMRLVRTSEEIRVTVARIEADENVKVDSRAQAAGTKPQPALTIPKNGFCIRCKAVIPANPERPYCNNPCYASWKRFGNKEYEEKYCHICKERMPQLCLSPCAWTVTGVTRTSSRSWSARIDLR